MRKPPALLAVAVVAGAIALAGCSTQPSGPPACPTVSVPGGVMVPDYAPRPCLVRAVAAPTTSTSRTPKPVQSNSPAGPASKPPAASRPANGPTTPKPMGKSGR
nr:hypothetical protein KPHV_85440 [Kitasatospora purpeofusca]